MIKFSKYLTFLQAMDNWNYNVAINDDKQNNAH